MIKTQPSRFLLGAALLAIALLILPSAVRARECPVEKCLDNKCELPVCKCASRSVPGNHSLNTAPQLVVFTFVGPLNSDSWYPLRRLFKDDKKNPNGEPITMTLFVSDTDTDDYCRAGEFYRDGHEIGVNGVSDKDTMDSFISDDWEELIMSQKEIITTEAKIDKKDIKGMHVPGLKKKASDALFIAIEHMSDEAKYEARAWKPYDSSIVYGENIPLKNQAPLWPYTVNYKSDDKVCPDDVNVCNHPAHCYDGVWEVPVRLFYDNVSLPNVFIDGWAAPENEEMLYYTLVHNFWEHYAVNRAPFVIKVHTDWFKKSRFAEKALERFIAVVLAHDLQGVYVVSMEQMLEWVKDRKKLNEIKDSGLFKRTKTRSGVRCNMATLEADGKVSGTAMVLVESAILLVLLVVFIVKDRAED